MLINQLFVPSITTMISRSNIDITAITVVFLSVSELVASGRLVGSKC